MGDVDYGELVLEALSKLGGKARRPVVLQSIHRRLAGRLSPADYDGTPGRPDYPAWEHQADSARNKLRTDGYIKADSPWGVWELTDRGRHLAAVLT